MNLSLAEKSSSELVLWLEPRRLQFRPSYPLSLCKTLSIDRGIMTLEDFEKSLAEDKKGEEKLQSRHRGEESRRHHKHHRHHEIGESRQRHKRRRYSRDSHERESGSRKKKQIHSRENPEESSTGEPDEHSVEKDPATLSPAKGDPSGSSSNEQVQRDSWMEEPSALNIDYIQKFIRQPPNPTTTESSKADFELKVREMGLNKHHLQSVSEGTDIPIEIAEELAKHEVDYHFGDAGAQWRMTKLKGVHRLAKETGRSVEDVAMDQYGDIRAFDDAREEQTELDRRDTYGNGYVGKEKPSGELFEERKLDTGFRKDHALPEYGEANMQDLCRVLDTEKTLSTMVSMDQTALNRLKAQMLKAKVRGSSDATSLEAEYNNAVAGFAKRKQLDVVVLGAMENRMLAGSRQGEITSIQNKRGRERGLVEESEDMSIEDMMKQERRNRHQAGGDGQRFAERIAKDAKFDNDLDYMDENANKLAKRVQKSEINLKNTAISDFQKINKILDNCPLCHHEDTDTPPVAPVVSLATRVYLTLPTEPEISDGAACIIPVQHRGNLLECDDDEWEEIRVCSPSHPCLATY